LVQEALTFAWSVANYICAKRLVPFLPELVVSLERHGHLVLEDDVRRQLLAISAATADRILRAQRRGGRPYGVSTTKAGKLLKHQVPLRTFSDWDDVKPGFMEIDLVAHCGTSARGSFLHTLVLTDVSTGWTECVALRSKGRYAVLEGVGRTRLVLPFTMLGIDTDNGSEFINRELLDYCGREAITFTRGRAYKKNDQCFVEQKNGSIVRQIVGYDRFEGEAAYQQLAELYRALRLYVNFFQPSVKLREKHRQGAKVQRQYDSARTPFQRLKGSKCLQEDKQHHLERVYAAIDPVRLLLQIQALQDALWKHAIPWPSGRPELTQAHIPAEPTSFDPNACVDDEPVTWAIDRVASAQAPMLVPSEGRKRKYNKSGRPRKIRTARTRKDPFEAVNEMLRAWLTEQPCQTAKALFEELQARYPGEYSAGQLRTLQRRVHEWRPGIVVTFDDHIVDDDLMVRSLPGPLRGTEIRAEATLAGVTG
jgi:hypothetical protein